MDADSKTAIKVLTALAESYCRSLEMADHFQTLPEVKRVSFDLDFYRNHFRSLSDSGSFTLDWYVDVELHNGNAIWWSLDISWDENKWMIESRVNLPDLDGPKILKQFPDRSAETIADFINELNDATKQLIDSAGLVTTQM